MLSAAEFVLPTDALGDAKTYLRVELADEDALIARIMASAVDLCEQFCRQALLVRTFNETIPATAAWTRLSATPVRTIAEVASLSTDDGSVMTMPPDTYATDIDANGDGWVRVLQPLGPTCADRRAQLRVSYEAGLAAEWGAAPEALRQGIVRLTAHLYAHRAADGDEGPPAAVTALWRPWRRMRIG